MLRTIPELKTYEIKLVKKYSEKFIFNFHIFGNEQNNLFKKVIAICDEELLKREKK
jgi:hypothetical protein